MTVHSTHSPFLRPSANARTPLASSVSLAASTCPPANYHSVCGADCARGALWWEDTSLCARSADEFVRAAVVQRTLSSLRAALSRPSAPFSVPFQGSCQCRRWCGVCSLVVEAAHTPPNVPPRWSFRLWHSQRRVPQCVPPGIRTAQRRLLTSFEQSQLRRLEADANANPSNSSMQALYLQVRLSLRVLSARAMLACTGPRANTASVRLHSPDAVLRSLRRCSPRL